MSAPPLFHVGSILYVAARNSDGAPLDLPLALRSKTGRLIPLVDKLDKFHQQTYNIGTLTQIAQELS